MWNKGNVCCYFSAYDTTEKYCECAYYWDKASCILCVCRSTVYWWSEIDVFRTLFNDFKLSWKKSKMGKILLSKLMKIHFERQVVSSQFSIHLLRKKLFFLEFAWAVWILPCPLHRSSSTGHRQNTKSWSYNRKIVFFLRFYLLFISLLLKFSQFSRLFCAHSSTDIRHEWAILFCFVASLVNMWKFMEFRVLNLSVAVVLDS